MFTFNYLKKNNFECEERCFSIFDLQIAEDIATISVNEGLSNVVKYKNKKFNKFNQVSNIKKPIKNARKLLKKNYDKKSEALELIMESKLIYEKEIFWRLKAKDILLEDFILLSKLGKETFGLRKQDSLNKEQAVYLARCKSSHEDISLYF